METSYQTQVEETSIKINAIPSVLPIFGLSKEERTKVVELGLTCIIKVFRNYKQ